MIRIFRNSVYTLIPLQEYLNLYHSNLAPDWEKFMVHVNEGLAIKDESDYRVFLRKMNLMKFDYVKMKEVYEEMKSSTSLNSFDDETLKFIAYLYGFGYFQRIGNPDLNTWLNAKKINTPFEKQETSDNNGYSLLEIVDLENGINAVKNTLLTALNW